MPRAKCTARSARGHYLACSAFTIRFQLSVLIYQADRRSRQKQISLLFHYFPCPNPCIIVKHYFESCSGTLPRRYLFTDTDCDRDERQ